MVQLTRHSEGSLRELWAISFPLMISSFSLLLMIFIDRLLLAHYSTAALNASVNASTFGWAFISGWMMLTGISEVFVAQSNGAGRTEKLGEPVWQMIWVSVLSCLFFIILAYFGTSYFYGTTETYTLERKYFHWMVIFGPSYAIYGALTGFFIGQGKTLLVTALALFTNLVNACLDVVLIFGIEGYVPSMGITGAAIATSSSNVFQVMILGIIFLNEKNRVTHGTANYKLNIKSLVRCLRIGLPNAIFAVIEILGWAAFYWTMTQVGERYITIVGICQSVVILFFFVAEGVSKGATAITGNLIGAGKQDLVPNVFYAGVRLHLLFLAILLVLFMTGTDLVISYFLPNSSPEEIAGMYNSLAISLFGILFYLTFEGFRFLLSGILTAAGDTLFLLVAGTSSVWLFLVAPVYYFIVWQGFSVEFATLICVVYGFLGSVIYFGRFKTGKWREIQLASVL